MSSPHPADVSGRERRILRACFAGWALDAFDSQLFAVALPALLGALALTKTQGGTIASATLVASAAGGWGAGVLSDRWGRLRVLQATILWFSGFTLLCGFAQNYPQLLAFKTCQGLGLGGEWAAGAVLVAEAVRPDRRGRALGFVQSGWAVGWAAAVAVYAGLFSLLAPAHAWRAMFALGVLPALLVLWLRKAITDGAPVKQPPRDAAPPAADRPAGIFSPASRRATLVGALLGVGAHGGYYALMTWLPTLLKSERALTVLASSGYLAVVIAGFFAGCLASARAQDAWGRRRNLTVFAAGCIATVLVYLSRPWPPSAMIALGFPMGFCAAGIPSTLGALFSELFPEGIRGTGVGFCYNFGRVASAAFPWLVGRMSASMPLGRAIAIDAALAYGLVIVAALLLPETKGVLLIPAFST